MIKSGATIILLQETHASSFELVMVKVVGLEESTMVCHRAPHSLQCCLIYIYIYISDILQTTSTQYGYTDDLALLSAHKTWEAVELTLNYDMQSLSYYLKRWRLKLSTAKIMTTTFHLNNRDAHRQLAVSANGVPIPNINNPLYLGVTLDSSLTYENHIERLRQKIITRNGLL